MWRALPECIASSVTIAQAAKASRARPCCGQDTFATELNWNCRKTTERAGPSWEDLNLYIPVEAFNEDLACCGPRSHPQGATGRGRESVRYAGSRASRCLSPDSIITYQVVLPLPSKNGCLYRISS
ncbi:MAG: hypothetical protein ACLR6J_13395 [Parabacteroides merdae]